jgi:hypothetical protein
MPIPLDTAVKPRDDSLVEFDSLVGYDSLVRYDSE